MGGRKEYLAGRLAVERRRRGQDRGAAASGKAGARRRRGQGRGMAASGQDRGIGAGHRVDGEVRQPGGIEVVVGAVGGEEDRSELCLKIF